MSGVADPTTPDSGVGVRLRLQRLSGPMQVLAVAGLAQSHTEDGQFSTRAVSDLFVELRLPPQSNFSAVLGRLRGLSLLMNPAKGLWSLTPLGEHRLTSEALAVPQSALSETWVGSAGATLGEVAQTTIPPFLGPAGTAQGLRAILDTSPFENNVMLITRFPNDEEDHFGGLIEAIREAVAEHGLILHLASDGNKTDLLWENVNTYMWACKYAIVLVDTADGVFNSNVLIEVGGMLMTGRRCAILKDKTVPAMPSDLVGHIYKSTDLSDHDSTVKEIHDWITKDLGLT